MPSGEGVAIGRRKRHGHPRRDHRDGVHGSHPPGGLSQAFPREGHGLRGEGSTDPSGPAAGKGEHRRGHGPTGSQRVRCDIRGRHGPHRGSPYRSGGHHPAHAPPPGAFSRRRGGGQARARGKTAGAEGRGCARHDPGRATRPGSHHDRPLHPFLARVREAQGMDGPGNPGKAPEPLSPTPGRARTVERMVPRSGRDGRSALRSPRARHGLREPPSRPAPCRVQPRLAGRERKGRGGPRGHPVPVLRP